MSRLKGVKKIACLFLPGAKNRSDATARGQMRHKQRARFCACFCRGRSSLSLNYTERLFGNAGKTRSQLRGYQFLYILTTRIEPLLLRKFLRCISPKHFFFLPHTSSLHVNKMLTTESPQIPSDKYGRAETTKESARNRERPGLNPPFARGAYIIPRQ